MCFGNRVQWFSSLRCKATWSEMWGTEHEQKLDVYWTVLEGFINGAVKNAIGEKTELRGPVHVIFFLFFFCQMSVNALTQKTDVYVWVDNVWSYGGGCSGCLAGEAASETHSLFFFHLIANMLFQCGRDHLCTFWLVYLHAHQRCDKVRHAKNPTIYQSRRWTVWGWHEALPEMFI